MSESRRFATQGSVPPSDPRVGFVFSFWSSPYRRGSPSSNLYRLNGLRLADLCFRSPEGCLELVFGLPRS